MDKLSLGIVSRTFFFVPVWCAVEQGLFQIVLDHEDNRAVLARQATERLPVSRTYLPTLFVNLVGQRPV